MAQYSATAWNIIGYCSFTQENNNTQNFQIYYFPSQLINNKQNEIAHKHKPVHTTSSSISSIFFYRES